MPRSSNATDARLGRRIAALRAQRGLTQAALALRLGISPQQVQKYEAGANRVSVSRLGAIAVVLGVEPATFFSGPSAGEPMGPDDLSGLRFMTATAEGRAVAVAFPLIRDPAVRQAIARLTEALVPTA